MLSSVQIKNWRCIEDLDLPLSRLTALVGPNGVGKSAVLEAIDFVLGGRWPNMSYLDIPRDFHQMDVARAMSIRCGFDTPLQFQDAMGSTHDIGYLEFSCKPYLRRTKKSEAGDLHDDYQPLSPKGEVVTVATAPARKGHQPEFGPLYRVSADLRDQSRVITIGDRRTVATHASGRRGSVLNQLLANVRRDFEKDTGGARSSFAERYEDALAALRTSAVQEIEGVICETAKEMLGFLGSRSLSTLDISFGFGDPGNPFGSLTVVCRDGDLVLPAEVMGLGIQSAIVIGVFEALRRQQSSIGTILIEEPEIYLHPQAQRYFHRLLLDLAETEKCQVIYTTHSPIFADMAHFVGIRLLKKSGHSTSALWVSNVEDRKYLSEQRSREKLTQYMDPSTSEALFASKVLLVEGHGDFLAAKIVAGKLGVDLDAEGLSVVACGGKNNIPFFARMCRSLGIPTVVLHDTDLYPEAPEASIAQWQKDENSHAPKQNAEIAAALGDDSMLFVVAPTLEAALGIGRSAADKPMKVADQLEPMTLDEMPAQLVAAVRELVSSGTADRGD